MKEYKLLLNVDEYDESFQKMVKELTKYSTIDVVVGDNYTLTDYDIFIGKKLSKEKLEKAIEYPLRYCVSSFPSNTAG